MVSNTKQFDDDVRTAIAGEQNKEWTVERINEDSFYVYHRDEYEDGNVVTLAEGGHCDGTYFQYNPSCPHIEAARQVVEDEQDEITQMLSSIPGLELTDKTIEEYYNRFNDLYKRDDYEFESEHVRVKVRDYRNGDKPFVLVSAYDGRFATVDKTQVFFDRYAHPDDIDVDGLAAAIQEADSRNEGDSE